MPRNSHDSKVAQTDYAVAHESDYQERYADELRDAARQRARQSGLLYDIETTYPAEVSQSELDRLERPNSGLRSAVMEELRDEMAYKYFETNDLAELGRLEHNYRMAKADFNALFANVMSLEESYKASKDAKKGYVNSVASTLTLGFMDRAKPNPERLKQIAALVTEARGTNQQIEDIVVEEVDADGTAYYDHPAAYAHATAAYESAIMALESAMLSLHHDIKTGEYGQAWLSSPQGSELFKLLDKAAQGKTAEQIQHMAEAYKAAKDPSVKDVLVSDGGISYNYSL